MIVGAFYAAVKSSKKCRYGSVFAGRCCLARCQTGRGVLCGAARARYRASSAAATSRSSTLRHGGCLVFIQHYRQLIFAQQVLFDCDTR